MDTPTYFDFIPLELLEIITLYVNDYDGLIWINSKYPKILTNKYLWINKVKESFERLYNVLSSLRKWDIHRIIVEKILDNNSVSIKRKIELYSKAYKVYDSIEKRLIKVLINKKYYTIKLLIDINDLIPFIIHERGKTLLIEDIEKYNTRHFKKRYEAPILDMEFIEPHPRYNGISVALYLTRKRKKIVQGVDREVACRKIKFVLDTDKAIELYLGEMDLI